MGFKREGKSDDSVLHGVRYRHTGGVMLNEIVSEERIVDMLRGLIARRGLKLPNLAKDVGVTYRTLQSYLYKRTRMPIGVYLAICARIGVPADYPLHERFKLDFEAMRRAVDATFGDLVDHIQVGEGMQLRLSEGKGKSQSRTTITHLLLSHYDRLSEAQIDRETGNDAD